MKKKTIKKVIEAKVNEWLESIDDALVRAKLADSVIVTGGCIASMLLREKVNDFDIYFTNREAVVAAAGYYVKKFEEANGSQDMRVDEVDDRVRIFIKSNGVAKESRERLTEEEEEQPEEGVEDTGKKYRPVYLSSNAITLSGKIQIVIRFYGDPEEIHQHYDYVHCTNYWTSKEGELVLKQPALEALLARELVYVGSKYPIASMIRTRKFINRGWTINAGQYLKMAYQVHKLDLNDPNVLEDQLTGVDVAYFLQLIDALKSHKEAHPDFVLNYGYLASIIDKMF